MGFYETNSRVGPDGKLLVALPLELANTDVHITVEPANRTNGTPTPPKEKPKEEWRDFIMRFAGSMPDFPDIERPGPEDYDDVKDWL
jgi:hypothetical protein